MDAAVAAQLALELPVRMGLATGEAELRDGDYFGAVLTHAGGTEGPKAAHPSPPKRSSRS